MKILFITGEYPPQMGGLADYTQLLAAELARREAEVTVLTSRQSAGLPAAPSPESDGALVTVRRDIPVWNWHIHEHVGRTIAELQPDVVHVQYEPAAYNLHPAITLLPERLRRAGVSARLAATFHDVRSPHAFRGSRFLDNGYVKRLARGVDLAITADESDAATLTAWRKARSTVVPIASNIPTLALDADVRAGLRAQAGALGDALLVGFFGFTNQSKGVETLIRGFTRFVSFQQDARLVFIGESIGAADRTNRDSLDALETGIEAFGLSNAVHRTGPLAADDVSRWLQAVDIVVLPFADGWSWRRGSLLAALANGAPVITTTGPADRTDGVRLSHGRDALLVAAADPEAIATSLRQAAGSPELRETLSAGARGVASNFTWSRIARDHLDAYAAR